MILAGSKTNDLKFFEGLSILTFSIVLQIVTQNSLNQADEAVEHSKEYDDYLEQDGGGGAFEAELNQARDNAVEAANTAY